MYLQDYGVLPPSEIYYKLPSPTARTLLFYTDSLGKYYCNEKYYVNRDPKIHLVKDDFIKPDIQTFDDFIIIFVEKGSLLLRYEGKEYITKENDYIFIYCKKPHYYCSNSPLTVYYFIHFNGSNCMNFYKYVFERCGCILHSSSHNSGVSTFNVLLELYRKNNQTDENIDAILIYKLLTYLKSLSENNIDQTNLLKDNFFNMDLNIIMEELANSPLTSVRNEFDNIQNLISLSTEKTLDSKSTKYKEDEQLVYNIIAYIDKNIRNEIHIEQLLKLFNISESNMDRAFKKITQHSPYKFIILRRLEISKFFLTQSDFSITYISDYIGFNKTSNFISSFKKYIGITPNEFRKKHKNYTLK